MTLFFAKVKGENECQKFEKSSKKHLVELTGSKETKAKEVKEAALEILQDALDKKLFGSPVQFYSDCTEDPDHYRYCSIITNEMLLNLIEKLQQVQFKEDQDPEENYTFAYVSPKDESCTVYLCNEFWSAPEHLTMDSKPGTLIHEVSHFLGTEDITYDYVCIELHKKCGDFFGTAVAIKEKNRFLLGGHDISTMNANSIEYEYETILNHQMPYSATDKKYPCCDETKVNSVCMKRDIGHYIFNRK